MINANYSANTLKGKELFDYESFYNTDLRATCPHRGNFRGTYFFGKRTEIVNYFVNCLTSVSVTLYLWAYRENLQIPAGYGGDNVCFGSLSNRLIQTF
jgi:hypothetical protein